MHPSEHRDQLRDVFVRCGLEPYLSGVPVVAQSEVGRARDARLHAARVHRGQHFETVAHANINGHDTPSIAGSLIASDSLSTAARRKSSARCPYTLSTCLTVLPSRFATVNTSVP